MRWFPVLLALCGSCVQEGVTSMTPAPQPTIRATIKVSQREGSIDGMGVLLLTSKTPLTFSFRYPVAYLLLRTRHRQVPILFPKPVMTYAWDYTPVVWVERDPAELSPLEVIAVDEKARETRALVVWHQDNGLSGEVHCNGDQKRFDGVSVCQSYRGLVQEIVFSERTILTVGRADCQVEDKSGGAGLRYQYRIPEGICVMRFVAEKDPKKSHRHVARGYSDASAY